jgi:hypothetical protein
MAGRHTRQTQAIHRAKRGQAGTGNVSNCTDWPHTRLSLNIMVSKRRAFVSSRAMFGCSDRGSNILHFEQPAGGA